MATEYYQLNIHGTAGLAEQTTSLVFRTDDATANATLEAGEDLVSAWASTIEADWLGFNSSSYEIRRYTTRRISPQGSAIYHLEYQQGDAVGNVGSPIGPLNLAPAVRLIPGTLGSTGGRMFLPSPPVNGIDNNTYAAIYSANVATPLDALLNPISGSFDWQWQVWHRKAQNFSNVVAWDLSSRFGFQGRRRYPIG
jgi:hypothetical protein